MDYPGDQGRRPQRGQHGAPLLGGPRRPELPARDAGGYGGAPGDRRGYGAPPAGARGYEAPPEDARGYGAPPEDARGDGAPAADRTGSRRRGGDAAGRPARGGDRGGYGSAATGWRGFGGPEEAAAGPGPRRAPGSSAPGSSSDLMTRPRPPTGGTRASRALPARPGGLGRRGPLNGFPPAPGQPNPVYPPGQFSAWNRPSTRAAWLGVARGGEMPADADAEPGYSLLAVSDPSADATSTQTWAVIDDDRPPAEWGPQEGRGGGRAGVPRAPGAEIELAAKRVPARAGAGELAARGQGRGVARPATASRVAATRRRNAAQRRRGNLMMLGLLLLPVLVVVVVISGYVYFKIQRVSSVPHAAPTGQGPASSSPAAALGPWKNIARRATDPAPLRLHELYPRRFSVGTTGGVRTVTRAGTKCARAVIGKALSGAVGKGGCTQVMRASYLSGNRKMMATIGVLNLVNVKAAERAGRAAGAREFIRQLPAAHGPTRNLAKGTGLEEADVKGHYLILIWAEFSNLHSPSGARQRARLEAFSRNLIAGTVNESLTTRMVTGKPAVP